VRINTFRLPYKKRLCARILWVRRKKTGLKMICSRCGQHVAGREDSRKSASGKCGICGALSTRRRWWWRPTGWSAHAAGYGPSGAVAEQSALQQALRGGNGAGVRECGGAPGGAAHGAGREHGMSHRSTLFGAMGRQAAPATAKHNSLSIGQYRASRPGICGNHGIQSNLKSVTCGFYWPLKSSNPPLCHPFQRLASHTF
jgi:hypothetical protein